MSIEILSPEMIEAEQEAKAQFKLVIAQKNELAIEAGNIAIGLAKRIGKGVGTARSYKFRAGGGFTQWNVTGLPRPETIGQEAMTSFIASSHKHEGPFGLGGRSIELIEDDMVGEGREFELSTQNTAYHPAYGTPYIDFIPDRAISYCNDPELLMKSYETAGLRQLDSAKHILNLVSQASESV